MMYKSFSSVFASAIADICQKNINIMFNNEYKIQYIVKS